MSVIFVSVNERSVLGLQRLYCFQMVFTLDLYRDESDVNRAPGPIRARSRSKIPVAGYACFVLQRICVSGVTSPSFLR